VKSVPFVSFVGAGPGEADLITVKGLRRLREAAVIVHDPLIAIELLEHAGPDVEIIDAGQGPGRQALGQSHLNWQLVDSSRRRGRVVRLMGGDPGVFARLTDEIEAVRAAGIGFEIVPGVSAPMAAAARVGISLTDRGRASVVVLATGADHHGMLPALDWDLLARAEGTLVFYMAVSTLQPIAATLKALGRDAREPALIVERVGLPDERVIAGRLGDIAEQARSAQVKSPAILLVGPAVAAASAPRRSAVRTAALTGV
jgi:uroporphyrin-III C-methyltransferase